MEVGTYISRIKMRMVVTLLFYSSFIIQKNIYQKEILTTSMGMFFMNEIDI